MDEPAMVDASELHRLYQLVYLVGKLSVLPAIPDEGCNVTPNGSWYALATTLHQRCQEELVRMIRQMVNVSLGVALALAMAAGSAQAQGNHGTVVSHGMLVALNDSGVTGAVTILNKGDHLRVNLDIDGLESPRSHLQHIHGFGDGAQATCPDMSLAGPDGVLSFSDGLPAYGPPVITLGNDPVDDGGLDYSRTFEATSAGNPISDLGDLNQYVVVVHGLTVDGEFVPSLPVACAVLVTHGNH